MRKGFERNSPLPPSERGVLIPPLFEGGRGEFLTIIISILLLTFGCNIFQTRSADPPDKPAEWHGYPVTPELCLENLVFAFNYRENVFLYASILSDMFVFNFDANDVLDFTVPTRWFKTSEVDMLMNVYFQGEGLEDMRLQLSVLPNQPDIIQSTSAWFYREYQLFVNHTIPNLSTEFFGHFQLHLERDADGLWRIREWHDYRVSSEWTFGRMKNAFSS